MHLAPNDWSARPPAQAAIAVAGPLAIGGVLAARAGALAPAIALPAIILGVTAITVPALYIATASIGSAPAARAMADAVVRALFALGITLLGLAAPLLFLVLTSTGVATWVTLASCGLAGAALLGVRTLHRGLFGGAPDSLLRDVLFVGWALVTLGIAVRLYLDLVREAVS